MSDGDFEEVIATIPRGERGVLRIARRTYNGSAPYTDVRHYFPSEKTGRLTPGKGITIKDAEIGAVLLAIQKAAALAGGTK